jgi:acetyl-CoA C-acetyltransferase
MSTFDRRMVDGKFAKYLAFRRRQVQTTTEGSFMNSVVISSTARTAIGSFGRSLAEVPPTELGATATRAAIARAGLEPDSVEHVVFGNVIHAAAEDMYLGRVGGMKAGIPKEAPALTLNRLCGSGLQAILSAAQSSRRGMRTSRWPAARSR